MRWALQGLSEHASKTLSTRVKVPSAEESAKILARVRTELQLNPNALLPPLTYASTASPGPEIREILLAGVAAEPDGFNEGLGMDQELPAEFDPSGERAHMGGTTGMSSQGFRHMYFGGWNWQSPLSTLQVPFHAIGQAPDRIARMAALARTLLQEGQDYWAWRVLGWSTHYVQDLSQPFHVAQIVSLRMMPWGSLLKWPPGEAFGAFVGAATHSVSNYHLAYEKYIYSRVADYESCMTEQELAPEPARLGYLVASEVRGIAPKLGPDLMTFFGERLRDAEVIVEKGIGVPDFASIDASTELAPARARVKAETCEALSWGVSGTRTLVEWMARTSPR